jgi:CheY-like chemotaxis protein
MLFPAAEPSCSPSRRVRVPIDLLLIDIAMPDEDGYTLIGDIRTNGLKQPAAALTARVRGIDRMQALDAGFNAHIAKPVEAHTLARTVATLVADARRDYVVIVYVAHRTRR